MIVLYTVQNSYELLESCHSRIESLNIQFIHINESLLTNSWLKKVKNDQTDV